MTKETTSAAALPRPHMTKGRRAEARFAYVFLLPALLLVFGFRIWPLVWGFFLSLTDAKGTSPGHFIGLENYVQSAADPNFRAALGNTVLVLLTLPIWVALPMLLAILIHQGVPGGGFFRAVYFFPAVLSPVIIGSINL